MRRADFPSIVGVAAERRGPQLVPSYAIRLADDYHRVYHECRVLGDEAQAFRLGLCRATQQVIATALDLLGIEAPERM
jgi:arginyl-tRNA synthetase